MPQEHTLSRTQAASLRRPPRGRLKQYRYVGDSVLTYSEDSDLNALRRLAEHFRIPFPITLESFRKTNGKHLKCGSRQVFPPPSANT